MVNWISKGVKRVKSKLALVGAAVVGAGAVAAPAAAQYTPPTLDNITFPIDTASVALAIGGAGAVILLAVFGWRVGFKLVNKLMRRLTSAV